ncbi:MAG TPA: radical SAM protein [Candidatus Gastranaerophilales bacterium]|nr:radical SAM protein [Candidatus Gastranaerophilales bacterium]
MKILMVYPECPDTFWSMKHIITLLGKKASLPPLGLMTVSALLPEEFEKRLIDLNTTELTDEDILWADFVFISAMIAQRASSINVIKRCRELGVKTVAGGPLFTSLHDQFEEVDHFILNEGEVTIPMFLEDLKKGSLKRIYASDFKPDLENTPVPDFSLINPGDYYVMPVQTSRGCPFDCDFCDIVNLNGRIPRLKTPEQIIKELQTIHNLDWKHSVFFVDDNFLGNKTKTKELLKEIIKWRKKVNFKPLFYTEISINASDDDELLELMKQAGFFMVFVGIETPSTESLQECNKVQNQNRDLIKSIRKFYNYGMEVTGGFIIGFDSDDETIFKRQFDFIQEAGVSKAMIEILQALPGTKLFKRLEAEGRLLNNSSGVCLDSTTNFISKMDKEILVDGYKKLIKKAYSPKYYFERLTNFLKYYEPTRKIPVHKKIIPSIIKVYIVFKHFKKGRLEFLKFMLNTILTRPKCLSAALDNSVLYIHFSKVFN